MPIPHTLVVLTGATGVGKTSFAIALSRHLNGAPILSADSRQLYRELPIGTAAPTEAERSLAPHYFVGTRSIHEDYSAGRYEVEVLQLLEQLYTQHPVVILCGGSMLYIDTICDGIDDIPHADPDIRRALNERFYKEGLQGILDELRLVDPIYYSKVDHHNYRRVIHGLEIYLTTGQPLSSYHRGEKTSRPFHIRPFALTRQREDLYTRIDLRVDEMIEQGLLAEAKAMLPYRTLNSLNTVGYKELFGYFDGLYDLPEAIRLIKRNSRHYARKQITWQRRHPEFIPLNLSIPLEELLRTISDHLSIDV